VQSIGHDSQLPPAMWVGSAAGESFARTLIWVHPASSSFAAISLYHASAEPFDSPSG
jgi:hypothetical protein